MPTSAPGSSASAPARRVAWPGRERAPREAARRSRRRLGQGFTLIELLVVLAIIGIASAVVVVSLPDRAQSRLDEEAERLAALLESARSEARASGISVRWEPASAEASDGAHFRFAGLPPSNTLPTQWLAEGTSAEVVGARALVLGPEPILPPQRVVLRLDDRRAAVASDGLGPFTVAPPDGEAKP
jgi:general secretion pathway protein H